MQDIVCKKRLFLIDLTLSDAMFLKKAVENQFEILLFDNAESCIVDLKDLSSACVSPETPYCVVSDFDKCTSFEQLRRIRSNAFIMGIPAFVNCIQGGRAWNKKRPVYNFSMYGAVVCITGFREREIVNKLATLINWMGGSVRRTLDSTTTHLVAYRCAGEKVRQAAILGGRQTVHTVKKSWVLEAWARRKEEPMVVATAPIFLNSHRARVFQEVCIAFVGFSLGSEELFELHSLVREHDGVVTEDLKDPRLSHVLVTDARPGSENILSRLVQLLVTDTMTTSHQEPPPPSSEPDQQRGVTTRLPGMSYRVPVLRLDWFWRSLQLTCLCQIQPYLYVMPSRSSVGLPVPPLARPYLMPGSVRGSFADEDSVGDESRLCSSRVEDSADDWESLPLATTPSTVEKENVPAVGTRTPVGKPAFPLASVHYEKVSFVTSPRARDSPRGFPISPLAVTPASSNSQSCRRSAGSLAGDSSQLFNRLTDPLSLPSNRELQQQRDNRWSAGCDLSPVVTLTSVTGEQVEQEESFHSLPVSGSTTSTLSPAVLSSSATQDSTSGGDTKCPMSSPPPPELSDPQVNRKEKEGSVCRHEEEEEVCGEAIGAPITSPAAPVLQLSASVLTGNCSTPPPLLRSSPAGAPTAAATAMPTDTPPSMGKRKSAGRLSLIHGRKSRNTPATPSADGVMSPPPTDQPMPSREGEDAVAQLSIRQDTPLLARLEKRQHRIFEFFVTERNYVQILRYLYRTAYPQVVDEEQLGGVLLPRLEADQVFGKLAPILELHERLQPQLDQLEAHWDLAESQLGEVLHLGILEEMERSYGNYMQIYSQPHLQRLGEQFPRFLAFMRQVERRRESGRQSLSALLVRPVQRLPSVSLLMEGIVKFTPPQHPDYAAISQFANGINRILTDINNRMRKNEERLSLLSLYHEINGAPPEMLSSSRSLVMRVEAFELGTNPSSGHTTCEPVSLFLLTDSLEIVRPRRRHTGEPLAYAIQAALAAVRGETGVSVEATASASTTAGDHQPQQQQQPTGNSETISTDPLPTLITHGSSSLSKSMLNNSTSTVSVRLSRAGSGASGPSRLNLGGVNPEAATAGSSTTTSAGGSGRQRGCYKHLQLLKLQDVKRVINFDTGSADRAAFGLVVRNMTAEADDRVHAFCLAAGLVASAAATSGRCPGQLESLLAAGSTSTVATLQHCVGEVKRLFLYRLCHHIAQASCLVNTPEELLIDVQSEDILGFDLELVFNSIAQQAVKANKFTRQLTRNISVKTPRRAIPSHIRRPLASANLHQQHQQTSSWRHLGVESTFWASSAVADDLRRAASTTTTMTTSSSSTSLFVVGGGQEPFSVGGGSSLPSQSAASSGTPVTQLASCGQAAVVAKTSEARNGSYCDVVIDAMDDLDEEDDGLPVMVPAGCPQHLDEYPSDGYLSDEADSLSIASGNNLWPAYTTTSAIGQRRHRPAINNNGDLPSTTSTSSLGDCSSSSTAASARNSLRRGYLGPPFAAGLHRKSVCQSVLAGLKSFRRSIAGAGSSLLFQQQQQHNSSKPPTRHRHQQRILNRSSSVDAGAGTQTMLLLNQTNDNTGPLLAVPASPLVAAGVELRLSRLSLSSRRTPAPLVLAVQEEEEATSSAMAKPHNRRLPASASVPLSRLNETVVGADTATPIGTGNATSSSNSMGLTSTGRLFPRSLTTSLARKSNALTSSTTSLRNLFNAAFRGSNTPQGRACRPLNKTPPKSSKKQEGDGEVDEVCSAVPPLPAKVKSKTTASMLSLTSWDSACTLDVLPSRCGFYDDDVVSLEEGGPAELFGMPRRNTVWETASHVDVGTSRDLASGQHHRRSFRALSMARQYLTSWSLKDPEGGGEEKERKSTKRWLVKKSQKKQNRSSQPQLFVRPTGPLAQSTSFLGGKTQGSSEVVPGLAGMAAPSSRHSLTCRRESILPRGLFSR